MVARRLSSRLDQEACAAPRGSGAPVKRILSLDGGGVRGAVAIAFLEELEQQIAAIEGRPVRLCDWFDLIGGTSTGAIIAGALALGHSASEIRSFYNRLAPRVFKRSYWRILGIQSKFDGANLLDELDMVVGDRTLGSPDIKTRLAIITKRLDTGSPWVLTNNPGSIFWNTPADNSFLGNRHYPLKQLIRASTAAPHYFNPQHITIAEGVEPGLFVDGGITPFNNPSLMLYMVATLPQYGLNFESGADRLQIISIGTGSYRERLSIRQARNTSAYAVAFRALTSQISDAQQQVLALMSWLGHSPTPWVVNSELGDLGGVPGPCPPLFEFLRYDIRLEQDWLKAELGETYSEAAVNALRPMDDPAIIPELYRLASAAAKLQVQGLARRDRRVE